MTTTPFARARNEEQREARRRTILGAAEEMLSADTRVAALSLNELSRHVGLAKSNVLRYFETREAVLLELLAVEYDAWLDQVETELAAPGTGPAVEQVADALSGTLAARPVLAELVASAAGVLEHNVSAQIAASYKRRVLEQAQRLVAMVETRIGPLSAGSRMAFAGAVNLVIGGTWAACRPSPGMVQAYEQYPELAELRLDYVVSVRELIATVLTGLLARPISLDRPSADRGVGERSPGPSS